MGTDLISARVTTLEQKIEKLEDALKRLNSLLEKLEGAGSLVKFLFFIVTPVVGAFLWAKDHVKF